MQPLHSQETLSAFLVGLQRKSYCAAIVLSLKGTHSTLLKKGRKKPSNYSIPYVLRTLEWALLSRTCLSPFLIALPGTLARCPCKMCKIRFSIALGKSTYCSSFVTLASSGCDQKHEQEMDVKAIYKNFVLGVMAARSPNYYNEMSTVSSCETIQIWIQIIKDGYVIFDFRNDS
ncbi:hypothetical protein NL676_017963 [Syzygium grande]|nr:hypothetical protein NL676_017963 [Syzygium grande]